MVYLWHIGRICEEFACLPLAAARELGDDPEQMVVQIMELRTMARVKAAVDAAKDATAMPTGPLSERVQAAQVDLWRAKRRAKGA